MKNQTRFPRELENNYQDHARHPHPHSGNALKLINCSFVMVYNMFRQLRFDRCLKVRVGGSCVVPELPGSFLVPPRPFASAPPPRGEGTLAAA